MVVLAVEFHPLRVEVPAHAREDRVHRFQMFFPEHVAPISGSEDKIGVRRENAMPAMADVVIRLAWSAHYFP